METSATSQAELVAQAEHAIWSQNFGTLQSLPQLDPASWAGSIQSESKRFGIDAPLEWPAHAQPAYHQACAIMMLKDEADIVRLNLEWLYFTGVRKFALINNGSTDHTQAEIEQFRADRPEAEVVTIFDPIVRYLQAVKTTALFRWAITMWPDVRWVFPVDADEFLVATKGLSILDAVQNNVRGITIPKVVHFRHRVGDEPSGGNILSRMGLRSKPFVVPPKVICRADLDLTITQGNHRVNSATGKAVDFTGGLALGIYYREFQTRDYDHFRRKVLNGGAAILAAQKHIGGGIGGDHWLKWYDTLQQGGDPA
ncbi:MAG: glycosyltransferase family 2 protein, partial [Janthinobacterium lividum]